MSPGIVLLGLYLPLFALMGLFQKRLRDAVAARHPDVARTIYNVTRSLPRSQRWAGRVSRYKMLSDPEIDRHIHNLSRVETLLGWAVLAFFVFVLVLMAVSATQH